MRTLELKLKVDTTAPWRQGGAKHGPNSEFRSKLTLLVLHVSPWTGLIDTLSRRARSEILRNMEANGTCLGASSGPEQTMAPDHGLKRFRVSSAVSGKANRRRPFTRSSRKAFVFNDSLKSNQS